MSSAPADPPERRLVGRYRILARIGEGGMGVVYLAESPSGERVAMKVLRPQVVGDDEGRRRLAREVASLRHVTSRHVAEVLDADPDGEPAFVVTRYVPGHSLQETVVREGPLARADLVHVARRLLEALGDVHAAGVLHRDVKPTNVVMEGRSPILIDFGLARLADDPRLTATGWLLGTPGYVAPEVLVGDPATPATDVHGWAATVAYAATGRPPYGRGHTMAILDRTRRGEHDLDGVPDDLRPILGSALATEPSDRPTLPVLRDALAALAARDLPTQAVRATEPADAPTMPWQLQPHEDPPTDVLPADRSAARPAGPPTAADAAPVAAPVAVPVPSPTRTLPAAPEPFRQPHAGPQPAYGQPAYGQPGFPQHARPSAAPVAEPRPGPYPPARSAGPRPLSGSERACRALLLAGLCILLAGAFRMAPYLTVGASAVAVLALRAASRVQQRTWQRRAARGRRAGDLPRAVLSYPWHVVCALAGTLLLVGTGAVMATSVAVLTAVLGEPASTAVAAGGWALALTLWWGPGGGRVRHTGGTLVTTASRRPAVGWTGVVLLLLAGLVAWLLAGAAAPSWAPADGPPWDQLLSVVQGPDWPRLAARW